MICSNFPVKQKEAINTSLFDDVGLKLFKNYFFPAETPIEEFTPTPAFPALQYLESVDVEGVAWRAGLRTGDFLIEVIKIASLFILICIHFTPERSVNVHRSR